MLWRHGHIGEFARASRDDWKHESPGRQGNLIWITDLSGALKARESQNG